MKMAVLKGFDRREIEGESLQLNAFAVETEYPEKQSAVKTEDHYTFNMRHGRESR